MESMLSMYVIYIYLMCDFCPITISNQLST